MSEKRNIEPGDLLIFYDEGEFDSIEMFLKKGFTLILYEPGEPGGTVRNFHPTSAMQELISGVYPDDGQWSLEVIKAKN